MNPVILKFSLQINYRAYCRCRFHNDLAYIGGETKIRDTFLGVTLVRIIVFGSILGSPLFRASTISGRFQVATFGFRSGFEPGIMMKGLGCRAYLDTPTKYRFGFQSDIVTKIHTKPQNKLDWRAEVGLKFEVVQQAGYLCELWEDGLPLLSSCKLVLSLLLPSVRMTGSYEDYSRN